MRGRGIFVELERRARARRRPSAAPRACSPSPRARRAPLFLGPLGWTEIARAARLGAAAVAARGRAGGAVVRAPDARRRRARRLAEPRRPRRRPPRWRYAESPRGYRLVARARRLRRRRDDVRLRGRARRLVADLVASPAGRAACFARDPRGARGAGRSSRCRRRSSAAPTLARLRAAPTTLHFMGKPLAGRLDLPTRARGASRSATPTSSDTRDSSSSPSRSIPAHPVLAATVPKMRALAAPRRRARRARGPRRARRAAGRTPRPRRSRSREEARPRRSASSGARGELARRPAGAVVAHMCPIYAVLAAPLARPLGVPRRALVHALERDARRSGWRSGSRPRPSASTGARSRSPRRRCVRSGTGSTSREFACGDAAGPATGFAAARARPLLGGEGARDDHARGCGWRSTTGSTCGSTCTGRR